MSKRKCFVVDTSVLLYDMNAIRSFADNDVVIPIVVLDEIDNFKDRPGLLGESARYINRFLDSLRKEGSLFDGVELDNGQTIRIELKSKMSDALDFSINDNKILGCALYIKDSGDYDEVKVVTKDINLRVKSDALNIKAEDYFKDHIAVSKDKIYTGSREVELDPIDMDIFYGGKDECDVDPKHGLLANEFVVGKTQAGQSLLAMHKDGGLYRLNTLQDPEVAKIEGKNKEQKFALSALLDSNIPLVTLTGIAGSGKTFLSLMIGLEGVFTGKYKQIIITRSIQPVGKDLGFLPGDVNDKMLPWLAPIIDNFRQTTGDLNYFHSMMASNQIEVAPLSYIRGRTFKDSFIIVDEAQNATIHELKTIITRVGKDSKVVLLGDTEQIDTPYIDTFSNGLTIVLEKFKESSLHAHVELKKGHRSELATEASKIL
jgi:PhoH-like ATPase